MTDNDKAIEAAEREFLSIANFITGGVIENPLQALRAAIAAYEQAMWQPISSAPKTNLQFLVTDWEHGDGHTYSSLELVNGPFLADGRILNQNSGNYTVPGVWKWWRPLLPPPGGEP